MNGLHPAVLVSCCALALVACDGRPADREAENGRIENGIWRTGIGDGPVTVIVIHGGPGVPHRYLRPEWDALADVARVVYYDQRGCGRSERTDSVTWERLADDLDDLVASARARGPVVLAGSSWGSILAVLYAYRHPGRVSSLVLSGVPGLEGGWFRDLRTRDAGFPLPEGADSVVRRAGTILVFRDDSAIDRIRVATVAESDLPSPDLPPVLDSAEVVADSASVIPELAARMGMSCPRVRLSVDRSTRETAPPLDSLARVGLPILVLRGTEPTSVGDGAEPLACRLPGARLVSIAGAGHDPWYERPAEFFPRVRAFLRDPAAPLPGAHRVGACPAPPDRAPREEETVLAPPGPATDSGGPRYFPRDVEPRLRNGDEVRAILACRYPSRLREAGIGGRVTMWLYVDATGTVRDRRIQRSSGQEALDLVALELADSMRFTPATNAGAPVPVWIAMPVVFSP